MKRWLMILSIVVVLGIISSATLAGHVYYNELKTYEDYDKKELSQQALKNIYIKSDVPVEIHLTKGQPYAEFTQTYTDIVGIAPKFKLEVEEKENTTYINVDQVKNTPLAIGVKEDKGSLVVYLQESDINKLVVDEYNYNYYNRTKKVIDLQKVNVKDLYLNIMSSEIRLNGAYDKVEINAHSSILDMESKADAQLILSGVTKQNLNGQFKKIIVKDDVDEASIYSTKESIIELNSNQGDIQLEGKYQRIDINGDNNTVEVRSETSCKLSTKGYDNTIHADGAFEIINMQENESNVEVKTTMTPKNIELNSSTISLTLPSNLSGYTLRCVLKDNNYENEDSYEVSEFIENNCEIRSDFENIEKEAKAQEIQYKYGDGKLPIILKVTEDAKLNIIDGGYSSAVKGNN